MMTGDDDEGLNMSPFVVIIVVGIFAVLILTTLLGGGIFS